MPVSPRDNSPDDPARVNRLGHVLLALSLLVFGSALLRTAWLNDDCFITQRVIDNLLHGFGLRWNVDERVQAFTSPAWLFVTALAELVTREAFYTQIVLGMLVSLAALYVLAFRIAPRKDIAAASVMVLACCPSFVEYSTSGLEQPLAHVLLGLLVVRLAYFDATPRHFRQIVWLASGLVLTRPDFALLILPVSCAVALRMRVPLARLAKDTLLGLSPLLAWEAFSLAYYGMFVPNTALAKLGTGEGRAELLRQGLAYLDNQAHADPVSLVCITLAFFALSSTHKPRFAVAWMAGVMLYLEYVISIGGCFMLGRYFTAPLLISVAVLAQTHRDIDARSPGFVVAGALVLGLLADHPAFLARTDYGAKFDPQTTRGVSDERQFYYQGTGLLPNLGREGPHPKHDFAFCGDTLAGTPGVQSVAAAGMPGWRAGPGPHLVDLYGLSDPLLARLPALRGGPLPGVHSGIGHHVRRPPVGYLRTLATGADVIEDRALARLFWQLQVVTRGPLWSSQRWLAIWKLNTGGYASLIDTDRYASTFASRVPLAELEHARSIFGLDVLGIAPAHGLRVELPEPRHEAWLEVGLGAHTEYELTFERAHRTLATQHVSTEPSAGPMVMALPVSVPLMAAETGYDAIVVRSVGGAGPAGIAKLRLSERAPGPANP